MKKFFCYIALVLLVGVIAVPPLLRVFYKEDDDKVKVVDKYELLTCTKDSYSIASSYKNQEPLNIKFKYLVDDPNLIEDNSQYALEYKLYSVLPNLETAQKEETTNNDNAKMISYYINYDEVNQSALTELSEYRLNLQEQKNYYLVRGYTCSVIE